MKKLLLIGALALTSASSAFADSIGVGMTEAKLIELKGPPEAKSSLGKKSIYRWPDMQVTLIEGKVENLKRIDVRANRANEAARAKAERLRNKERAKSQQKILASSPAEALNGQDAEEKRLTEEISRKGRITALERNIMMMDAQLDADAKRSSIKSRSSGMTTEQRDLLKLRLEKAKRELENLR